MCVTLWDKTFFIWSHRRREKWRRLREPTVYSDGEPWLLGDAAATDHHHYLPTAAADDDDAVVVVVTSSCRRLHSCGHVRTVDERVSYVILRCTSPVLSAWVLAPNAYSYSLFAPWVSRVRTANWCLSAIRWRRCAVVMATTHVLHVSAVALTLALVECTFAERHSMYWLIVYTKCEMFQMRNIKAQSVCSRR